MKRLENKTAVITGGTTGIGLATAQLFIQEGARVIITGRNEQRLSEAVAKLGGNAITVKADVRSLDELDLLVDKVKEVFGSLDILFANAGVGYFTPLEQANEKSYDNLFDTNVKGVFFTVQKLAGVLKSGGSVILNASAANGKGAATGSIYFATKAAVRSFARSLAIELGDRQIRVNSLSPGIIRTEFQNKLGLSEGLSEALAQEAAHLGIKVTIVEPGAFRTDWAGRSLDWSRTIDDYEPTVGQRRKGLKTLNGNQPGDPQKAAEAIYAIAKEPNPPLRLALGADAFEVINSKLKSVQTELENWQHLTLSTDYEQDIAA